MAATTVTDGPADEASPDRRPGYAQLGRPPEVCLLGGFGLIAGADLTALPPGCQRLLAFLALRSAPVRRGLAAGTLWPDSSETRAHSCLRSALARLNRVARGVVEADPADVRLAGGVRVDLHVARQTADTMFTPSNQGLDGTKVRAAISLLSRDLLPGWYEDWVFLENENWRQLRLHALEALAARLLVGRHFADAALAALAAVGAEPLRESAHVALVQVHLAEGNRAEALRAFERFRGILRAELGIEPSQRLAGMVAGLHPVAS